jgi:hypothetical protein
MIAAEIVDALAVSDYQIESPAQPEKEWRRNMDRTALGSRSTASKIGQSCAKGVAAPTR